jgi:siderophore synthetase component
MRAENPSPDSDGALCRRVAEQAAIERLLNSYLRETGIHDARVPVEVLSASGVSPEVIQALLARGAPMRLELPRTGGALLGAMAWISASGHHRFDPRFWFHAPAGAVGGPVETAAHLAQLLVEELAAGEPGEEPRRRRSRELLSQIGNSIDKAALYVGRRLGMGSEALDPEAPGAFLAAEQRVLLGHPFHPTPKSSEGFTAEDLERYAPELGASFPLHYLAVRPELIREDFIHGSRERILPASVHSEVAARWAALRQGWSLLPCHPWQADALRRFPGFRSLLEEGRVVELGPLGGAVHPTSSVRTVFVEGHRFFLKLALGVRITNFVRTNPPEQLERSLDASRVVAALQAHVSQPDFTILLEVGWRALSPPGWEPEARRELAASTGVLFREAPAWGGAHAPLVVAALLEPAPQGTEPLVVRAVRRATRRESGPLDMGSVRAWLRRYLRVSLVPLLTCFIREGLSLEAHVQNSLVSLVEGWPARFYVRDLEGTSLSRDRAARHRLYGGILAEDSPLLYGESEAWQRLLYYFFVNHLGHLLATLACATDIPEQRLWHVVRETVESLAGPLRDAGGARYLEELLDGPTWPAKANLRSRFLERGERPLYLSIPNPLHDEEVSSWS